MRPPLAVVAVALLFASVSQLLAQGKDLAGTWFSNRGVVEFAVDGKQFTAKYGDDKANKLSGTLDGRKLAFEATEGRAALTGTLEFDKGGCRFTGDWRAANGNEGQWRGWRADPALQKQKAVNVAGLWRTGWGLLELEQSGNKLKGGFGAQGWSTVTGGVIGRHVELDYETPFGTGTFHLDVEPDGKLLLGSAKGERGEWPLQGQRLEGHTRNVAPKPGAIVHGIGDNRMIYYLRVPKAWKAGAALPLIVILHGSNYCSRPYVESIAASAIGERYVIVGIDGEAWEDWSKPDDPRQNYTYVNFMGKSTYQGYPNTHRESPALVAELVGALQKQLEPTRTFVGGHSQGGFLTWFFAMHYPELVDGVFPISCGLVMQCEPDVFDKPELRERQRRVAIAVVHGKNDPNVAYSQGRGSWLSCMEQGFPRLRLFDNDAGHGFSSLPWLEAVAWLEAMTGDDAAAVTKFGEAAIDDYRYRDATAAVARLRELKAATAADALSKRVDEYGEHDAEKFVGAMAERPDGAWIDEFLEFRDKFEFADCAKAAMAKFRELRAAQDPAAKKLFGEARKSFQAGNRDGGWEKYEQLVKECWASALYPRVKVWLAERK